MHIFGQQGDANEPVGYLPSQVANEVVTNASVPSQTFVNDAMGWVEKTLRKASTPKGPNAIIKNQTPYDGRRYKLWKSRETGAWIYIWPERGFVHMERDSDGYYKKWTIRDALRFAYGMGQQSEVTKYPDEKQKARDAYLTLLDVIQTAKAQGDPTEMTDEEKRALKESIACATVPGMGKITFVGSKIQNVVPVSISGVGGDK